MKFYLLLFSAFILFNTSYAQKISGTVTDVFGKKQSFASIIVKGSAFGVSANDSGNYDIRLKPGTYTIQCAHVGYKTAEKKVTLADKDIIIDFKLETQQYNLATVVVHSGGEDPAYEIIRQAIKLRSKHLQEIKKFQCEVYIKGILQLRNYPKHFLGNDVDFEDGDTSKKKIIFLSETVARYSVEQPNSKIEVFSTKVSGNSDGYGFGAPQIVSFYSNDVQLGNRFNPRGFISPIADNALNFYTYKFEGSFYDNGTLVDRIQVIPKHKYEPLFTGVINIIEDEWRIYSVNLTLLKVQQLEVLDTLNIQQIYVPVNGTWLIKQQNIYPAVKFFGFDAFGSFVQVYNKFNLQPHFAKNYFGHSFLKYDDSSNKKSNAYWDTVRPIPLHANEIEDYKKKDSLEKIHSTVRYMDSVDRKRNKVKAFNLIFLGQRFSKTAEKFNITLDPLFDDVNFNTVEGVVANVSGDITKTFKNKQELFLSPNIRYGFNNDHLNAHLTGAYKFNKKNLDTLYFSGGRRVIQYNNADPITPRSNTLETIFEGYNYMKLYEMNFIRFGYNILFKNGLSLTFSPEYQDRSPLENTILYTAAKSADYHLTPNYPVELSDVTMPHNHALTASINFNWNPGVRYIEFPDRKVNIGSNSPVFDFLFKEGIHGLLNSDVSYSKLQLGISQSINMHIYGRFEYNANLGSFLSTSKLYLPDYQQFTGNQVTTSSDYLKSFQLMNYYQYNTAAPFYAEAHIEYHLNGLLTNKIPLFKKLNWFLVVGGNGLYTTDPKEYGELFVSIENIFKVGRIDFVQAFGQNGFAISGIKFSVFGLINSHRED